MNAKQFQLGYLSLITLTWLTPPVIGLALLFTETVNIYPISGLELTSYYVTFSLFALTFAIWHFNRLASPLYRYLNSSPLLNQDAKHQAIQTMRRHFPFHYWGTYSAYSILFSIILILITPYPTNILLTSTSWLQINLGALMASIVFGLLIYSLLNNLLDKLNDPPLEHKIKTGTTLRSKILLTSLIMPLLISGILTLYFWIRTGYFTQETVVVWLLLTLLATLSSFTLLRSINQPSLQQMTTADPHQTTYGKSGMILLAGTSPDTTSELSEAFNNHYKLLTGLQQQQTYLVNHITSRTSELAKSNREFEAFAYAVSHDLRSPLRSIKGFSEILLEDYTDKLDANGKEYLNTICQKTKTMSQLIDDLTSLSNATYQPLNSKTVNLSLLAMEAAAALKDIQPTRSAQFLLTDNLTARCDERLIKVALGNLLDNAWKYSLNKVDAVIEFGYSKRQHAFYVKDNGIGFDVKHAYKLFTPFQRLHSSDEFPGSGIGLATVQRIIDRHNGKIWAESSITKGSIFYFNLNH